MGHLDRRNGCVPDPGVLFEVTPDVIARFDRSLRFVDVKPVVGEVTGLPDARILGARLADVVDDAAFAARFDAALGEVFATGRRHSLEHEVVVGGDRTWACFTLTVEPDPTGEARHVLVAGRDTTATKHVEDALRDTDHDLRTAQAMAGIGSWSVDLLTGAMTWTDELFTIFGYEVGVVEPDLRAIEARVHAEDLDGAQSAMASFLASRQPLHLEFRVTPPGGLERHVRCQACFEGGVEGQPRRLHGTVQDITRERDQAAALERSGLLLDSVLQSSVDGIMAFRAVREGGKIVDFEWLLVNEAAARIVGRSVADLTGRRLLDEMPGNRDTGLFARYLDVVRTGELFEAEHHYASEGLDHWFHTVAVPLGDGFAVTFADVSERRRTEAALRHQELHDPLTGLANRALLLDRLRHALERRSRSGEPVALLSMDVHCLRAVNEAHGHDGGDAVLQAVAARLRDLSRVSDTLGRLGSDEFLLLCEGLDATEVDGLAVRLLEATAEPVDVGAHQVSVQADIGVVMAAESDDVERLLAASHSALLQAKAHGPGCHEFLDEQLQADVRSRSDLAAELGRAIDRGELEVHYQPVVRTSDLAVTGFEALVRWRHPDRGLVPPVDFIPLAEATGQIVAIGELVLLEACRQRAAWSAGLGKRGEVEMAVNLGALELADPAIIARVKHALALTGIPASDLCLEVTETGLLDVATAPETLEALSALGVRIALDDFGTGYSSVGHLRRFAVDILKIDRSFVADLPIVDGAPPVVAALTALAHTLDLQVVAEGVETVAQLEAVRRLGVQRAQGYHFAPALPAEEATAMLTGRSAGFADPAPATGASPVDWDDRTLELVRRLPGRFLVVLDESYTVRWASHFAGRVLGTTAASLIGRPAFDLVHPDDREVAATELSRLSDEAATDLEVMEAALDQTARLSLRAEDGSAVRIEFRAFNLFADPDVVALGLLGHVVSRQVRLDAVIDRLGTETPVGDVLALLTDYLDTAVPSAEHRIVRFVGGRAVAADGSEVVDDPVLAPAVLDQALVAGAEPTAFTGLGHLPVSDRDALAARGLVACFMAAIVVQGRPAPLGAVVSWIGGDRLSLGVRGALETTARLAGIALSVHGTADVLRTAALTDALTGVGNRRQLDQWAATVQGSVAVLAVDLDGFKPVNDRYGHAAGDIVLVTTADRLVTSCREGALISRPGGDEYVVLLPGIGHLAQADAVARRLAATMVEPIDVGGAHVVVSASVGSALRAPGEPMAAALARADAALYTAKAGGPRTGEARTG